MLVILDRDGVINEDSPDYVKSVDEWIAIPQSLEAIARLNHAEHKVAVATNQSGLARGYFSHEALENMHKKMQSELAKVGGQIDGIYYCPHHPDENCSCRKPKPGLLNKIIADFCAEINDTILIGDSWRDIQAARAVGCRCLLVLTGNGHQTLMRYRDEMDDIPIADDLAAAIDIILD